MVSGLIQGDPHLSLKDMSAITGMSTHTVRTILKKDLNLRWKCTKFIPTDLTDAQKWTRMTVCQDNIDRLCAETDPESFMRRIITGDETWISTHEMEFKSATSAWVPPDQCPKKPLKPRYLRKTMLTVFFDCKGVILAEYLKPGETIKSETYVQTLARLKECIRHKRPELWKDRSFLLHHDNASPHTSDFTLRKLQEWKVQTLDHPPNLPDLAPCNFALFPKLKSTLRGRKFDNIKQVQAAANESLKMLPKSVFDDAIHNMVLRWQKCVAANGEFFEGDNVQVDPLFAKGPNSESESSSDEDC